MNLPAAVLVLAVTMVLLPLSLRAAIALRGRGLLSLLALASVPSLLCLGAWWVSRHGTAEEGRVTSKSESLDIGNSGLDPPVSHRLTLSLATGGAKAQSPAAAAQAHAPDRLHRPRADLEFDVDEALYDASSVDSLVPLHLVQLGPLKFARLDAEPWWNIAPGRLERILPPRRTGLQLKASARILSVRTVNEAIESSLLAASGEGGSRTRLRQPYDEVRLQFTTEQGADIIALDRIDAGSAGVLVPGGTAVVVYPKGRPRLAQLAAGSRAYTGINAWNYWSTDILGTTAALIMVGVCYVGWRRVRSRVDWKAPRDKIEH